ncbi:type II 3-dehydroquinate dehydratase [Hugenholtzia roseola]
MHIINGANLNLLGRRESRLYGILVGRSVLITKK